MKTPQELDKIYNRLPKEKIELSVEKVELAQYDFTEFKKQYDKAFSNYRTDFRKSINQAKQSADLYFKVLNDILQDADKLADDFGNKAEDLGLEYRGTKPYQQFQEIKKIILSAISNAKEKQRDISKIM
jgi:uncharacterized phage infection (PIP) family protein YhgE